MLSELDGVCAFAFAACELFCLVLQGRIVALCTPSGRLLQSSNLPALLQEAADNVTLATERQKQVVSQLNPLNHPSVQALLGKK